VRSAEADSKEEITAWTRTWRSALPDLDSGL